MKNTLHVRSGSMNSRVKNVPSLVYSQTRGPIIQNIAFQGDFNQRTRCDFVVEETERID